MFGLNPHYVLWGMSYQMLNSMIMEAGYRSKPVLKDEKGEYEWYEYEDYDGKMQKVKKYKDSPVI